MIRFLFVRLIFPLVVLWFVRALFRSVLQGFRTASLPQNRPQAPPPPAPVGGELKKDPVCGTYVSTIAGLSRKVDGQLVYFCSEECRKKYRVA